MSRRPAAVALAAAALLAGAALPWHMACRRDPVARYRADPTTLAVVGRYAISAGDFEAVAAENLASGESQDAIRSRLWDRTVEEVLVLNDAFGAAPESGVEPLSRVGTAEKLREAVDLQLQREVYSKTPVSDEEVSRYYRDHPQEFQRGRGYLLRQVTVPSRALAEQVRGRLLRGERFESVARRYCDVPELGEPQYFQDDELPDYLASALKGLRPGHPSPPVNVTAEAWQVVRVEKRADSYTLPFESVSGQIRLRLADERSGALYLQYIRSLRARFPVHEFPKKLPFAYQKEAP